MDRQSFFDKRHPLVISPALWVMGIKEAWAKLHDKFSQYRAEHKKS